jgi:hypothetical protein
MFKVTAGSVEEYFRFDPAREDTFANTGDIGLQAVAEMVTAIAAGLESGQLVAR